MLSFTSNLDVKSKLEVTGRAGLSCVNVWQAFHALILKQYTIYRVLVWCYSSHDKEIPKFSIWIWALRCLRPIIIMMNEATQVFRRIDYCFGIEALARFYKKFYCMLLVSSIFVMCNVQSFKHFGILMRAEQ